MPAMSSCSKISSSVVTALHQGRFILPTFIIAWGIVVLLMLLYWYGWDYGPPAAASSFAVMCSWVYLFLSRATMAPAKSELDDVELVVKQTHDFRDELPKGMKVVDTVLRQEDMANILGQRGPTCAAASVANALNVVFKRDCHDETAFKVRDAMAVYKFIFTRKRTEAVNKLSKLLKADASCVLPYLASEKVCLAARARNKDSLPAALMDVIAGTLPEDSDCTTEEVLSAMRNALETIDQPSSALIIDRVRRVARAEWAVAKLEGRWKLPSGSVLPSTAPIGNVNVGIACKSLALLREKKDVRVTSFMGLSKQCRHVVSKTDTVETRERHWEELKLALDNKEASLIFHLHNHYALIAGWRTLQVSTSDGPVLRRQVLTARTGQAPLHWVDWEGDHHARSKLTGQPMLRKSVQTTLQCWKGHRIMLIEQSSFRSKRAVVDPEVRLVVASVSLDAEKSEEPPQEDAINDEEDGDMAGGSSGDEAEA